MDDRHWLPRSNAVRLVPRLLPLADGARAARQYPSTRTLALFALPLARWRIVAGVVPAVRRHRREELCGVREERYDARQAQRQHVRMNIYAPYVSLSTCYILANFLSISYTRI